MKPRKYKINGFGVEIKYTQHLSTKEETAYTTVDSVEITDKQELFEYMIEKACEVEVINELFEHSKEPVNCPTCDYCKKRKQLIGSIRGEPLYKDVLVCRRFPSHIVVSESHFCAEYKGSK